MAMRKFMAAVAVAVIIIVLYGIAFPLMVVLGACRGALGWVTALAESCEIGARQVREFSNKGK
jgi:uncharacterized RDD family membrane protein YckC